jgi:hypothetical protein
MNAPRDNRAPAAPVIPGVEEPGQPDPNVDNPYRSPLEPTPNDPFVIPDDANPMPVQNPTPGGVPPAPASDE